MQETKRYKTKRNATPKRARHGALVVAVCLLSAACVTKTIVEFRCPFPCPNADVADEELDGKLDDAPATLDWIADVEFECGCIPGAL